MKIYVSDKEIIENDLLDTERYDIVLTKYREDFWEEEIYPEIQSLEQHEAEIRKPLEDTVKRLLQEIKDLECLVKLKEQAKQERQKVIAELEEWADENLTKLIKRGYFLPNNLRGLRLVEYEELKQKLNEMKEKDRFELIAECCDIIKLEMGEN